MDYLRDKLRHVYGDQGRVLQRSRGERWTGTAGREQAKRTSRRRSAKAATSRFLLCTESASEGLNLQTCGVLINYEMPWNPMRVEQRIGRIDRIGQEYDRVWIRNYFYDGTR